MLDNNQVNIDTILPLVRKPGRYVGGELNAVEGEFASTALKYCLVFPDLYEIGMSHQGLQILYHILNGLDRVAAHRCYTPDIDMEQELRQQQVPLFSLEARLPLGTYDVLGFTLPYELCYTNILTVLSLSGIPFRSEERNHTHPLVIGGGSCAMNPEPVAEFFDAIILGDGEEVVVELSSCLLEAKQQNLDREALLVRFSRIKGVYIPSLFKPHYDQQLFTGMQPLQPGYARVNRRVLPALESSSALTKPLVPIVKPVHDRLGVEIARGCTRGCRFCQAGILYRPVRERSLEDIMAIAKQGIEGSGFDELALLSLSTGDYSCLGELMLQLMDHFTDQYVSVSMPSMRVGTLSPAIMQQIQRVRKTGFTVAPEAGTDRLREVINKGITEEDLLTTCRDAFSLGWNLIKLYFMVGLPTETEEDVEAIVDLARKAKQEADKGRGGRAQINVSVATFVPKPHTPFQWQAQLSLEQSKHRINMLKKLLPRKGFKLKWHDPHQSLLEGVFSRGDRRLSRLIEAAWHNGVRLDGWSEHFRLENWQLAAEQCAVNLEEYLEARPFEGPLPWDHLESGTDREFLQTEYTRAMERQYTPDCRTGGCHTCGLCDFKNLKPIVGNPDQGKTEKRPAKRELRAAGQTTVFTYRVHYSRLGDSRWYGHLELLQLVFRALQRSGLEVLFSSGFNPSPRVSFSQALPVGVESLVEYFDVDLAQPLPSTAEAVALLNKELPQSVRVSKLCLTAKTNPVSVCIDYQITSLGMDRAILEANISAFLSSSHWVIERIRKKKRRELDLRLLVVDMVLDGEILRLQLIQHPSQAGTNPREVLEKALGFTTREALLARILKTAVTEGAASA